MNIDIFKNIDNLMIIGHINSDVDSILSSIILKNILNKFNIKTDIGILENNNIDLTTTNMIKDYKFSPIIINNKNINDFKYILVDHNDVSQSINNPSLVIGIIDHHLSNKKHDNMINKTLVSTTAVIYDTFKNIYNFNDTEKEMIYKAIIHDSAFGTSIRYNEKSKNIVKELGFSQDLSSYLNKYFIPTNMTNINYSFNNSRLKNYKFNNISFKSTALELVNNNYLKQYKDFIKNNPENILGIYINYKDNISYMFFKYNNSFYEKTYNYIVSRANEALKDCLNLIGGFNEKDIF